MTVDSRIMSLDVKILFGNLSFSGCSPGYPVNATEIGDFNLGCETFPVYPQN